eukprot:403344708
MRRNFSYDFKAYRDMNLYNILNLDVNASTQEIKQAYYEMAKKHHPDSNHNSDYQNYSEGTTEKEELNRRFQEIQMAYEILGNPDKRLEYDQYRGRSYYENQYQEAEEGNVDPNDQDTQSDRRNFKKKYSGYEWYWMSANQMIIWAIIGVISNNFYENWHFKFLAFLRKRAHEEKMRQKFAFDIGGGTLVICEQETFDFQKFGFMIAFPFYGIFIAPFYLGYLMIQSLIIMIINPKLEETHFCYKQQVMQQNPEPNRPITLQ